MVRVISAAQEERFTRKKMIQTSRTMPRNFASGTRTSRWHSSTLWFFTTNLVLKFARLLETFSPSRRRLAHLSLLSNWLGEKLDLRKAIRAELPGLRAGLRNPVHGTPPIPRSPAQFYPSPFDEAVILTLMVWENGQPRPSATARVAKSRC